MKPYTIKAKKALDYAKRISKNLSCNYIGSEHILAGLLKENSGVASIVLKENNVEFDKLLQLISELISSEGGVELLDKPGYSPRSEMILKRASEEADRFDNDEIGTEHLLLAIIFEGDSAAFRLLNTMGVNIQKLLADIMAAMGVDPVKFKQEMQKNKKNDSVSSTPTLDQYSRDLTELARNGALDPVIGRTKETKRLMQILCRRGKNNPCLIGEPGVGKTAIVEGIAQSIVDEEVPELIAGKRLVSLDMSGMVAKSKYRGEFEERIKKVLNEIKNHENPIVYIDEIHTIVGAGSIGGGSLDTSNLLKPYLMDGKIKFIGATTFDEYKKYFEKDKALSRRFQTIEVKETSVSPLSASTEKEIRHDMKVLAKVRLGSYFDSRKDI